MPAAGTIAVLVKHVPVGGELLGLTGGVAHRDGVPHGLDPVNEPALEWALRQRECGAAGPVVAISMGPPEAADTLRRAFAFGADDALLVTDPRLAGADVRRTARVLAAAVGRVRADVVACGYESLDGSSGVVPAALAAELDRALVSRVSTANRDGAGWLAERDLGAGPETVRAPERAVLTFVDGGLEVRYPRLRDSLASRRKQVDTVSLAGLGLDLPAGPGQRVLAVEDLPRPRRQSRRVTAADGPAAVLALLEKRENERV